MLFRSSRPCAFDRIGERIVQDRITESGYDSEMDGQMDFSDFPEIMPDGTGQDDS